MAWQATVRWLSGALVFASAFVVDTDLHPREWSGLGPPPESDQEAELWVVGSAERLEGGLIQVIVCG